MHFSLVSITSFQCHHRNLQRNHAMQVQNLNGDFKTNIDVVGNVFNLGFSFVNQHNLLEVPMGLVEANNTEPRGDH